MHNNFKALTLSYKTAPLEIRGEISLDEQSCRAFLEKAKEATGLGELMVLSTCNRTEIYYHSESDFSQELIKLLGIIKGRADGGAYNKYFVSLTDPNEALLHLYRVSVGLESQVVGDIQISNQVKKAYQWAVDADAVGPFMHRLLHSIFFTHKRIVQETAFRDGAASVSYAAVEIMEELIAEIAEPKILVVGIGEIGTDVVKNLVGRGIKNVKIANRTYEKAKSLGNATGFEAIPFENVWEAMKEADVIVSSVATSSPFINKERVLGFDILSFKYFIDLAVPKSVAKEVEEIPGALVFDVDNINNRTNEALERRKAAIPQVEGIVQEAIGELLEWSKEKLVSPTIQKLKNALEDIRQKEMARFAKQMDAETIINLEKVTKSMMQQIIKLPVLQLKAACKRGEAETLVDVLNDLFDLEKKEVR